jgi:hypothetical protein
VARKAATQGRAIARQLQLAIRTEFAPQLAGTYGTGPSFDMVAMSAELPEDPLKSKGSGTSKSSPALGPRPVDIAPDNWRELERSVIEEFQRSAPKNSSTYYTSRRHKLSTIWNEFQAFVKVLQSSGQTDPIPNAKPEVLELTRGELIKGTPLGEECEGTSRWLEARLRESDRRVAASDRGARKAAEAERSKWQEANVDWLKWLGTKVGNQMLDLFELNPTAREAAVIDPSYAWSNRLHNLKSRVYLESLNKLLGWKGGSALDVGKGRFQSRIFYDQPKAPGGAQQSN